LTEAARKAARWGQDHTAQLTGADPELPGSLGNRVADNWRPLIAIADAAGGRWPECARAVACSFVGDASEDDPAGVQLLADIRTVFANDGEDRYPSATLSNNLAKLGDRPWKRGKERGSISAS
jgi:hypothetical protein